MTTRITDSYPLVRERLPLIDVLRGVALLAMVTYHFSWDLAYYGFVPWEVSIGPAWRAYAMAIAGSFLALSGISLVLAARGGVDPRAFAVRLAKIGGAAALVSLGTFFLMPDGWIYFGILHMIAVGSLLALPFLRAPVPLVLIAAAVVLVLPWATAPGLFDAGWLAYTGLSATVRPSNDFVPIFPWFAAMLVGVAIGRAIAAGALRLSPAPPRGAARALSVLGRWSLPVYLLHQPVLFGAVALAALWLPAIPSVERSRFVADCERTCGADEEQCSRFCGCVAEAMDGTTLFSVRGGDPDLGPVVSTAAMACRASEFPPED